MGLLATALALSATGTAAAAQPEGEIVQAGGPTAVQDSYIVVLKKDMVTRAQVADKARDMARTHGGKAGFVYDAALRGFEVSLSQSAARRLAANPAVDWVQQNHTVSVQGVQPNPPSWGLDRIDQRKLPLDSNYYYPNKASTVNVYVIDSGIRLRHTDFDNRAVTGFDAITPGGDANDCDGHGTHVAGTIGGTNHGVAKEVKLHAVRVFDCAGKGTVADAIAGVDWVTKNHVSPAVANMSLRVLYGSLALDTAVTNSINSGVTYVVAAGNDYMEACDVSPARVNEVITVAATTNKDARPSFSNYGKCVDIFAPGSDITSAWATSDTATDTKSGTSMASPHVAGAAAMLLHSHPSWTPAQVKAQLIKDATPDVVTNAGPESPNRLLYIPGPQIKLEIPFVFVRDRLDKDPFWRLKEYVDLGFGPIVICPRCFGPVLGVPKLDLPLDRERMLYGMVMAGMQNLGRAHTTESPEEARRYQEEAQASFRKAVELTEKQSLRFSPVGYQSDEKEEIVPAENQPLANLASNLTEGLAVLREANAGGSPELVDKAMRLLNTAYADFVNAAELGGLNIDR
ncbi:S8 family serine peptidase [Micromonospora sp. NPDC006766]|uniref:S8 family peptidase n=1 Tax=Micromonospora sp. NPDC006766 TaxID=3154778 RepID=UPI0033FCD93D